KLFHEKQFTSLPSQYYLKRWSKHVIKEVTLDGYGEAIRDDTDPSSTARYSELLHIVQRIVTKNVSSESQSALVRSLLLEVEAKMASFAISKEGDGTQNLDDHEEQPLSDDDVTFQNPKGKKTKGDPKGRLKFRDECA
ncbi:hypothetical protein GIB67_000146, partial [Kingdonia uniflora]